MHPTPAFRHGDKEIRSRMIREIGFATIFLQTPNGPRAAHAPIHLTESRTLRFHLARGNALVRHLRGKTALAVINGPDAYISARWYTADNRVPTWNYIAFELSGTVTQLDSSELPALLEALSDHYEGRMRNGSHWTMSKMDAGDLEKMILGIAGFEMAIETVRETMKLSQNVPTAERARLIAGLESEGEHTMAHTMRKFGE